MGMMREWLVVLREMEGRGYGERGTGMKIPLLCGREGEFHL